MSQRRIWVLGDLEACLVDHFRLKPIPYKDVQLDINISPHLSSEYISYLENPVELLNEAAKAAEQDIWNLMQFTEDLRRQYGKEPRDMELLLKKLYVRRMAADLGISRIYPSGKMIIMETNMNRKVFRLMEETMASETHRNSLSFTGKEIKVYIRRENAGSWNSGLEKEQILETYSAQLQKS
ncbi:hypothetical protein ACQJBY_036320 [Aegilops geniculata]